MKKLGLAFLFFCTSILSYSQNYDKALNGKYYLELNSPSFIEDSDLEILQQHGVDLLQYIDDTTYLVQVEGNLSQIQEQLSQQEYAFTTPDKKRKLGSRFEVLPRDEDELELIIHWQYEVNPTEWQQHYQENRIKITHAQRMSPQYTQVKIKRKDIDYILGYPEVRSVDIATADDQALNNLSRGIAGADYGEIPFMNNGLGYRGQGITIGVGDNANVQFHADLVDRLINHNGYILHNHGYHTTGMAAGAGLLSPRYRGMLPEADIVSSFFSRILDYSAKFYQDYNMTVTNNSYGAAVSDCSLLGLYDATAEATDQLVLDIPEISHVFAAGNNGEVTCPGFSTGNGQILGQYQAAKNVLVVGNIDRAEKVFVNSSRGPMAYDLRLKPDVCADGANTRSCYPLDAYGPGWGTSMSSPAVAGLAGVLQQYYLDKYSTKAKSDLIKATIINGAQDLGRSGPDVEYGFGRLSTYRSLKILENESFIIDSVGHQDSVIHTIQIPSTTEIAKILLYYHDVPGIRNTNEHLINDLDMYIIGPSGQKSLPLVVNMTDSNTIRMDATPLRDSINNSEQIVLENPAPGSYQIIIKGHRVTLGMQVSFVVSIDTIPRHVRLRTPIGGETWFSPRIERIYWDDFDLQPGTIDIDYSFDQGATWVNLRSGLDDSLRGTSWNAPKSGAQGVILRLKKSTGSEFISETFTTSPQLKCYFRPEAQQCPGFTKIYWNGNGTYTDYLVYQKVGPEMKLIDSTTAVEYLFSNQSQTENEYYAIQPRIGTQLCMRTDAIKRIANTGDCMLADFDDDVALNKLVSENVGRELTSRAFGTAEEIKIELSNHGSTTIGNIELHYAVNAGSPNSIAISNLSPHQDTVISLPSMDFSTPGTYDINLWVENLSSTDPFVFNDSLDIQIRQLANPSTDLSTNYTNSFETASEDFYLPMMGLYGLEEFDLSANTDRGRARSYFIEGNAQTGQKSMCLDADYFANEVNTDTLVLTKNFSSLDVNAEDIRLDFYYSHHGQYDIDTADNKVFVRGSDSDSWIEIFDLFQNQNVEAGTFERVQSIEISKAIRDQGQNVSSSTQIAFVQSGNFSAGDDAAFNGYSFDDLELYTVTEDIILEAIDTPSLPSCGLNSATPIRVKVRNAHLSTINNISAGYRLDGGAWVLETIPTIPADSSIVFSFATLADFTDLGSHTLDVYIFHSLDSYRDNDSLMSVEVYNQAHIDSFPYLTDFEDDGGYFTFYGRSPSWLHGTPSGQVIRRAASKQNDWQTGDKNYNRYEYSFLQSPCFDVTQLTQPYLSFNMIYSIEGCGTTFCDGAWMEISDDGENWEKLDLDTSTMDSWYSDLDFYTWNGTQHGWRSYSIPLPTDRGDRIQVRWVMNSDPGVEMEGMAIDDVHVYDHVYNVELDTNTMVVGDDPVLNPSTNYALIKDGSVLMELVTGNNDLGASDIQYYHNTGPLRTLNSNYILDRNLTIKPQNINIADTTMLRIYIAQADVDKVVNDTNCTICPKPEDFIDFGITKFSSIDDDLENNLLFDNTLGAEYYYLNESISKVPYKDGYYFEIPVWAFSEFWINTGLVDTAVTSQLKFDFVRGQNIENRASVISWGVVDEYNNHHFEIERATGNDNYQNANFEYIASVNTLGNNSYNVYESDEDIVPDQNQVYYYRIKSVNNAGEILYSDAVPVVFGVSLPWILHPNPFLATTNLQIQLPDGKALRWSITDMTGRIIAQETHIANAQIEEINIGAQLAAGVYFLQVECDERKETFKINKL